MTTFLVLLCLSGLAVEANAFQADWDTLQKEVEHITKLVESTKIIGTKDERQQMFLSLHQEIERLDALIDGMEKKAKADSAAGQLTADEYKSLKRKLDVLENRLERAEKRLDKKFGIRH